MTPQSIIGSEQIVMLGPYQIYPHRRLILEADRPLRLGSRAMDILLMLLENAGKVVSKDQLIARVWPDSVVEEINLRVHIAALRKALGDGRAGQRYIINVPQRGYSLVAVLSWKDEAENLNYIQQSTPPGNLPPKLSGMIGRADVMSGLVKLVRMQRLVTLVGPGGIGKTTVALHVAELLLEDFPHGVFLLDLAPLAEPEAVAAKLATTLKLLRRNEEPLDDLTAFFSTRKILLVLDNCEHLIDAIALLAETLLRNAPRLYILATSREALRIDGEHVRRIGPLQYPPESGVENKEQALNFTALQLLVERAKASQDTYELTNEDLQVASDLCRRLDGIPLAIELAAAQIGNLGVRGVLAQLSADLRLLPPGRRTALPRQKTLHSTLGWSHELLAPRDQACFRRAGVFRGHFTLESAGAVIAAADIAPDQIALSINQLVAKSLMQVEIVDDHVFYRLFDTTRNYALEKLRQAGELPETQRRLAEHYCTLLSHAQSEWGRIPRQFWLDRYAYCLDDIRNALEWGFSPEGLDTLAVELSVVSTALWQELSLLKEHAHYVGLSLAALERQTKPSRHLELALRLVQGNAWYHTQGGKPQTITAFVTAHQLAQQCDDFTAELKAISGLMAVNLSCGHYRQALEQTQHFKKLCNLGPAELALSAVRLQGLAQHFVGNQVLARRFAEEALASLALDEARSHFTQGFGVQYDQEVAALTLMARTLWLQGYPEQAWRMADKALQTALRIDHGMSICYTLALSTWVIAKYNGDSCAADNALQLFHERALVHNLRFFQTWARHYSALGGSEPVPSMPDYQGLISDMLATVHPRFADAALLDRAEAGESGWATAEILRIKAVNTLAQQLPDQFAAERLLQEAIAIAQQQGALAWELRCSTSLAQLRRDQGHLHAAYDLLASVYGRFTEGFSTPDLLKAKQLLEELQI
ncbi:ATP-binding protein [Pseudomonas segetis]|uniref:Predicted ATPase n=1 Tax=Pseudomonas segetis TaxID=298908 RepID=A0A239IP67_9PSED|nr:winged helix-turn-helix domain-containing protein [Pseudomonas segetis]SNS95365.1 Predicted ATPase [Pseudomonas segetis]